MPLLSDMCHVILTYVLSFDCIHWEYFLKKIINQNSKDIIINFLQLVGDIFNCWVEIWPVSPFNVHLPFSVIFHSSQSLDFEIFY